MFRGGFVSQTHTACISANLCALLRAGRYAQDNPERCGRGFPFPTVQMPGGVHDQSSGVSAEGKACPSGKGQCGQNFSKDPTHSPFLVTVTQSYWVKGTLLDMGFGHK